MRLSALIVTVASSLVLLSGCATLTKEQCMVGNWQSIGYSDGAAGYTVARLAEHNKACAKAGVAPDYQAWERGRQQGLKQYCTVSNAYEIGKRGKHISSVCPADMLNKLQQVNAQGREHYTLSSQVKEQEKQLDQYKVEYNKLRDGELLDFKSEAEARTRLLLLHNKIRDSSRQTDNAKTKLRLLEQKLVF
jgi:hypothetical protein